MEPQPTPWSIYGAHWLVETWEPDREVIREKLAYCNSFACAEAAYKAAVEAMPYERIIFRHRMRVIKEHVGKWTT